MASLLIVASGTNLMRFGDCYILWLMICVCLCGWPDGVE